MSKRPNEETTIPPAKRTLTPEEYGALHFSAVLYFDGGSRNNGSKDAKAGAGFYLEMYDTSVWEAWHYMGHATNNEAEYTALKMGLKAAKEWGVTNLVCKGDSLLVVSQMRPKNPWKVKAANLKILNDECKELAKCFRKVEYEHIPRENNTRADSLANKAMNKESSGSIKSTF